MTSKERLRHKCRADLFYLAKYVLEFDFLIERFHKPICDFVQDMSIHRKLIRMPRSFLKTTICSQAFPIWLTINNPNVRILLANMVYDNAAKNVHVVRKKWENCSRLRELFGELFPKGHSHSARWSDASAEIKRTADWAEGTYESIGVGGSKIGSHYNFIIEDDLVGAKKDSLSGLEILPNADDIQKAIGWHGLALNLLVNPKADYITNVGTRWGQYDLIRHIIDNQPKYKKWEIDAVEMDEKDGEIIMRDGEWVPTYPERFDLEQLEEVREEQGDYVFSMMYLGKPYNIEDMIFRDEWIKTFEGDCGEGNLYAGLDMAGITMTGSRSKRSDFSALGLAHINPDRDFKCTHYVRGKFNPTQILDHIFDFKDTYDFKWLAMEKFAYEQMIKHFIDERNRDRAVQGKSPVIVKPVKRPKGETKGMHIRILQPLAMAGKLYIRPWMRELRGEFREFTGKDTGGHNDLLDLFADIFRNLTVPQHTLPKRVRDPFSLDSVMEELLEKRREFQRERQLLPR